MSATISVTKTPVTTNVVYPGGLVVWEIVITNLTAGPVGPFLVRDLIPPAYLGPPVLNAYGSTPWVVNGANYEVTTTTLLALNDTLVLVLALFVTGTPPGPYVNGVGVYDTVGPTLLVSATSDPVTFTPLAPPPTLVPLLEVQKYVTSANLNPGGFVAYNVVVTNIGQASYTGALVITDTPGTGLTWNGLDGWVLTAGLPTKNLVSVTLDVGQSQSYTIGFNVGTSCIKTLINSVAIASATGVSSDSVALGSCCDCGCKKRLSSGCLEI